MGPAAEWGEGSREGCGENDQRARQGESGQGVGCRTNPEGQSDGPRNRMPLVADKIAEDHHHKVGAVEEMIIEEEKAVLVE